MASVTGPSSPTGQQEGTSNDEDVLEVLYVVATEENLRIVKVTAKGSMVSSVFAAVLGFLTGILAAVVAYYIRPAGFAAGTAVDGISQVQYKKNSTAVPVADVIAVMEPEKRTVLAGKIRRIMGSIDVKDTSTFASKVSEDPLVRQRVLQALTDYLTNEMQMVVEKHS